MNMKKSYETFCFEGEPDWQKVPVGKIDCFQWEVYSSFSVLSFTVSTRKS